MDVSISELINKYGNKIITDSDLTPSGGLKNKDRVLRKLNIMFEHVDVFGRGRNIKFILSGLRKEYELDKRHERITDLQRCLLQNLKYLVLNSKLPDDPLTPQRWLNELGLAYVCKDTHKINKKICSLGNGSVAPYLFEWEPNLIEYDKPDIASIQCDPSVTGMINHLLSKWYSSQFLKLIPKASHVGISFSEVLVGLKKDGKIYKLKQNEIDAIEEATQQYTHIHGYYYKMSWCTSEHKEMVQNMGYTTVYKAYTCNLSKDMAFLNANKVSREEVLRKGLEAMKKYIVYKELGEYKGFFDERTCIPYELKNKRLDMVSDIWMLRSIDLSEVDTKIVKRLKKDYELLLDLRHDRMMNKLKCSRTLYKSFKVVVKVSTGIDIDDEYYYSTVKKWQQAYEAEVSSGINSFSVTKALENE